MNLGFTGTRNGMTEAQWHWTKRTIRQYLDPDQNTLHHGCCIGADSQAHMLALMIRRNSETDYLAIVTHPPANNKYRAHLRGADKEWTPRPYLERNRDIVDCSDRLIACPAGPEGQRSGTWATIRYARKKWIPITIIWRDGTVTEEK